MSPPRRLLFVCTGNICRSPTAEAVARAKAAKLGLAVETDGAGTSAEEAGNPPDPRAREAAARRGYDLPRRGARRVRDADFRDFDLILTAARQHRATLLRRAPAGAEGKVRLLMDHAPGRKGEDVPDPWYGGQDDFEHALNMIEAAVDGLTRALAEGREG